MNDLIGIACQLDRPPTVQIEVEFHVLSYLGTKILLGRDVLNDYGMDLLMSKNTGSINMTSRHESPTPAAPFLFDLEEAYQSFRSVSVRMSRKVTIGGRSSWQAIPIKSFMTKNRDYMFEPYIYVPNGAEMPITPQQAASHQRHEQNKK